MAISRHASMSKNSSSKISDDFFISVVKETDNKTISDCLKKMNISVRGRNYETFRKRCEKLHLDISHLETSFSGRKGAEDKKTRDELSDADLINIVAKSTSRQNCLKSLNLDFTTGANVRWIDKKIKQFNLSIIHWTGQGWSKGLILSFKTHTENYLSNTTKITSHKLRQRLIREKIFEEKCQICNLTYWLNQPIALELHHKDGNHYNNELSNLQILCPNCHATTDNYKSKNIKKYTT